MGSYAVVQGKADLLSVSIAFNRSPNGVAGQA